MVFVIITAFVLVYTPTWFTPRVVALDSTEELASNRLGPRAMDSHSSSSNTTFNIQAQENYVFIQEFAPNEQFSNPDITIDKQTGNIYVADYFNNRVIKFSSNENIITQWGSPGSGDGQFQKSTRCRNRFYRQSLCNRYT